MKKKLYAIADVLFYFFTGVCLYLLLMIGSGRAVRNELCWKFIQHTMGEERYRLIYSQTLRLQGHYYQWQGNLPLAYDKYKEAVGYNTRNGALYENLWNTRLKMLSKGEAFSDWLFYGRNTYLKEASAFKRGAFYEQLQFEVIAPNFLDYKIEGSAMKDLAYLQRGLDLAQQGDYTSAEQAFNRAIHLNKQLSLAYLSRGYIKYSLGDWVGAEADLSKLEGLEPGSSRVMEYRAANFLRMGNYTRALQELNNALLYRPENWNFYLGRSRIQWELGEKVEAYKDLAKSASLYGHRHWLFPMTQGYYAELEGKREIAWNYYREAEALLDRSDPGALFGCFGTIVAREIARKRTLKQELLLDRPYELNTLLEEVIAEQFKGDKTGIRNIAWTKVPNDEYYGCTQGSSGEIKISCQLNSSQVPKECVKFVIYHECLHAKSHIKHDSEFYYLEGKYPEAKKWNKLLDYQLVYCYEPKAAVPF